jgi:hypothetical protein
LSIICEQDESSSQILEQRRFKNTMRRCYQGFSLKK